MLDRSETWGNGSGGRRKGGWGCSVVEQNREIAVTLPLPTTGPHSTPCIDCSTRVIIRPDASSLDDVSLLSRLLGGQDAESRLVAGRLIDRFGDLGAVAFADDGERARIEGLSSQMCADLKLVAELAVRLSRTVAARRPVITSWTALLAYVRCAIAHRPREEFRVLYLDRRNMLLRDEVTAEGTVDHAPVYPREVMRRALELSASAMILVHNHPSGDPTPSRADIDMTRKIVDAARVLGLQVHDHLVVGREGTASFKSLGLL